jgi:coproporphyrinogen dehydrogenase HemZ
MYILIDGISSRYEYEKLARVFFPDQKMNEAEASAPDALRIEVRRQGRRLSSRLKLGDSDFFDETLAPENMADDKNYCELTIAQMLCRQLIKLTGFVPPWGLLTGIRPMKLLRMLTREYGKEEAERRFMDDYLVSEKKLALSRRTLVGEDKILSLSKDNSFSLYISVPFCPSRCSYCSFVSQSVEHAAKLIPQYTELLVKELKITAEIASSLGLHLESVYMGGGTPTTLSAEQMERVLTATGDYFDLSGVHEFTVEAGRPDTITPEKLAAIKRCGVGRISINPQTLSDDILRSIGRRHTVRQVYEAMDMAKAAGFDNINMDLIAGLQGDTLESYRHTIDGVIALGPSSITVHTLAMKRSASMVTGGIARYNAEGSLAAQMLDYGERRLTESGYDPYYLYRQSGMVGNLENVGWAKPGFEGAYNVFIMDETHTILAVGGGAVTKLKQPGVNNIERIFNYKYPYEYISRFDEMVERKKGIKEFYDQFC